MARVLLSRAAEEAAAALPSVYVKAVATAIDSLAEEPMRGKVLRGRLGHLRSLRVGVYRILYRFDVRAKRVLIAAIKHRSEAYRDAR